MDLHSLAGMVSHQLGISLSEALLRLRARAFAQGRFVGELVADVVARRVHFDAEDQ
jgi:hypothetical protein